MPLSDLNLRLALRYALSVRHHLGLALRLELVQVRQDRVELLARRPEVLLVVQEGRLLRLHLGLLALYLLRARRLRDRILLRELVIAGLRLLLGCFRLGKESSEASEKE